MSDNGEKKKKSILKRLLKWSGIGLVVILLLLIAIPYFFKDQIIQLIKDEANASLNATLDFSDADLTFISTFPNLTLTLDNVSLTGKDEFEGVNLVQIEQTSVKLDFWNALFGEQFEIEEIILNQPDIYIKVLENGKANYDIAISDSTATDEPDEPTSAFKMALDYYQIIDGDITYDDAYYLTFIHLANLNHEGNVLIDDVIYTLDTKTESGALTFGYDGFNYLDKSVADIDCALEIAMPEDEMKLTFKENNAKLNALNLNFDGSMLMKDDFIDFDFTFATVDQTFKSLLSIVPGAFTEDFDNIKTDGSIALSGALKGKYSETDMPGFSLNTVINNAWLQYPDLPSKLENINLDLDIAREEGPDLDNLIINLNQLSLEFLENKVKAALALTHPMTDPNIKSSVETYLDLSQLNKVIPLEANESYSGIITSDISLKGKMSAIEQEKYEEFEASGNLKIEKMLYSTPSLNYAVAIDSMLFNFSPESLELANFKSKIGQSDIAAAGKFTNYLPYILKDEVLQGQLSINSNLLNLDELMYTTEETPNEGSNITEETTPYDSSKAEVFQIPTNIDFTMATSVKELIYDSLALKNLQGNITVKDGIADLSDVNMEVFDGNITLNGQYQALNPKRAKLDFSYDINNLSFQEAFGYFNTVQKYASIAKYCEGNFSTKLKLDTELDEFYYPIYQSITGLGDLTSNKVEIKSYPLFDKVGDMLKTVKNPLDNQVIKNLDLSFSFEDGKIQLKETPIKLGNINTTLVGTTSFTKELDYKWNTVLPSNLLGDAAGDLANNLVNKLNNAAGTSVEIPKEIPVTFNIGGTVMKPSLVSNLKESGNNAKDNLIEQGKDLAKDKLNEEAKKLLAEAQAQADKIIAEANEQAAKIRATAEEQASKIEQEADIAYDKALAETEKQSAKMKKEGYDAAQKLIDEAKNPVAKIAAEKAAEKLRKETDEKVANLESAANKTAEKAKQASYDKADQIRNEGDSNATKIETTGQNQADKIMLEANNKVDKMTE